MTEPVYQQPNQPRRLVRTSNDKVIAGVCGGIARYANVDANLVRVAAVIGLLIGFGSLGLAYLIAWVLMPEE